MPSKYVLFAATAAAAALTHYLISRRRRALPSSSYLRRAEHDSSLIANRQKMIELFLDDVATPLAPPPTRSASPQAQLRLVTWNLNILCGPDWNTPVQAAEVASLLESLEADVLVLQELPNEALDKLWSAVLTEPLQRVRELDGLLRAKGWTLLRSLAENSTLLAVSSRLQVEATEAFHLDDEPTASLNGDEVWSESRGARYAVLRVPATATAPCSSIAVYATHLSHKDSTIVPSKESTIVPNKESAMRRPRDKDARGEWLAVPMVGGVRLRQVDALLRHWSAQPARDAGMSALVLADFNSPVRAHYSAEEWRVIAAGLRSPHVDQPLDDGVAARLRAAGFRCAYELGARNNFGGRPAPPLTHWTGTTVDFAYVSGAGAAWEVLGAYAVHTPLSDHLPVIIDVSARG